ncbi:MAG: hypothetical protein AAFR38_07845 [Planctomycetota bacterium]
MANADPSYGHSPHGPAQTFSGATTAVEAWRRLRLTDSDEAIVTGPGGHEVASIALEELERAEPYETLDELRGAA